MRILLAEDEKPLAKALSKILEKNNYSVDAVHDNSLNVKKLVFDKRVKTYADSINAIVQKQTPSPSNAPVIMGTDVTLYLGPDPVSTVAKTDTTGKK